MVIFAVKEETWTQWSAIFREFCITQANRKPQQII